MGLQISSTSDTKYLSPFVSIAEGIQGGITLSTANLPSDKYEVKEGQLVAVNSGKLYEVVKTVKLTASLTSAGTTMYININNFLKVGDFITPGDRTPQRISAITRGATYDTVTLASALAGAADMDTNDLLFEALTSAVSTNKHAASALLRDTVKYQEADGTDLQNIFTDGVVRGTVNESLLPTFATTADKTSLSARVLFI